MGKQGYTIIFAVLCVAFTFMPVFASRIPLVSSNDFSSELNIQTYESELLEDAQTDVKKEDIVNLDDFLSGFGISSLDFASETLVQNEDENFKPRKYKQNAARQDPETTLEPEDLDTTSDGPATTPDGPATTSEDPVTSSDPATTSEYAGTTSEDPVTSSEDPATTSEDAGTTSDGPATTSEDPDTTSEDPATTSHGPDTTSEDPDTTSEDPYTTSEDPHTTSEDPDTTSEDPDTTSEDPDTTSEDPDTTSEDPYTTSEDPDTTSEDPDTTSEDPDTTSEDPDTTSEDPDTTSEDPDTTSKDPDTTSKDPETTTGVPGIPIGQPCNEATECINWATCENDKCRCSPGTIVSDEGLSCRRTIGQGCEKADDCIYNAICDSTGTRKTCSCNEKEGFLMTTNSTRCGIQVNGKCTPGSKEAQCIDNAECHLESSSPNHFCRCLSGFTLQEDGMCSGGLQLISSLLMSIFAVTIVKLLNHL